MKVTVKIFCFILLLSVAARAEIEKNAAPCETGFCLYWWPKLPQLKGWHQDKEQSYQNGVNALSPDGSSFADAETVIYANAIYKPRTPKTKSLDMFITDDKKRFFDSDPGVAITEVTELLTGDAKKFRSFTFSPKSKGNWEQVSYGEEGDYYLTFVLSSRSKGRL